MRFRLVTLGRLALCPTDHRADAALDELNARRRKVALLAVLALRKRPVSRDTLIEMFWGEQDEVRARHSLSDAVSHLRRVMGRDAIVATRSELSLAPDAPLVVDAVEFADLIAAGSARRALVTYGGKFLEGVHVPSSTTFENWAEREQARLERAFVQTCARECAALSANGPRDEWISIAERWVDAEPMSADAALALLNALGSDGSGEGEARVLATYEQLRVRLAREYGVEPDPAVARRAQRADEAIRARAQPSAAASSSALQAPPQTPAQASAQQGPVSQLVLVSATSVMSEESAVPASVHQSPASGPVLVSGKQDEPASAPAPEMLVASPVVSTRRRPTRSHRTLIVAATTVAIVAASAVLAGRWGSRRSTPEKHPVVAVAEIALADPDTSMQWLGDGLPQMIAAKLSRSAAIDVVPAGAIRVVRVRSEAEPAPAPLPPSKLRDLGRRVGASLVVSGMLVRHGPVHMLELRIVDVHGGRTVRVDAVSDSSVLTLVDRAVVRLLDEMGARNTTGPRLAELETANLAAYQHFIRSQQIGYERPSEALAELDAAVALDSGFTSAVLQRMALAFAGNDAPTINVLNGLLAKQSARIPERDRLDWESRVKFIAGDLERSEQLALLLLQRYPRDPRSYELLQLIYENLGRWDAQQSVLERLLALDSLGMEAGHGLCMPCLAFGNLTTARLNRGDWIGAENVARRWAELTPDMHVAWTNLALVQAYRGHFEDAFASLQHATALAPEEPGISIVSAWLRLMSRDYAATETAIAAWDARGARAMHMQALDLRITLQRERGQFRAANAATQRAIVAFPELASLDLVRSDGLVRVGECRQAVALLEGITHGGRPMHDDPAPGGASRAFAWHHALLADVIARSRDCGTTPTLEALADSIERIGGRSYYGRDWSLHHHVRGLIAERRGDYARAEDELRQAQWRIGDGWTRSQAELAKVQLGRGRFAEALATLRAAHAARPDAMGRYQPRTELDYLMALAFRRAGALDSAAVYEGYVRHAWQHADPEVKGLLRNFDRGR